MFIGKSLYLSALFCSIKSLVNADSSSDSTVNCTAEDCGNRLFLTRYLKSERISDGQEAARVPPLVGDVESYSGFLTVDEKHESNMFFWFFPAETSRKTAPLVLWLEGGPGGSSLIDTLYTLGPYHLDHDGQLELSNLSWTRTMNVLYIDNPVGVGFSFTKDSSGFSVSEDDVRRNLYSALCQFFQLFPEYQNNEFFIAGISYAGKYIPSLAYSIHQNNPAASIKINLKGIAIGNGLVDFINQIGYSGYLYNLGLIDLETEREFAQVEKYIESLIVAKRYEEAAREFLQYLLGISLTGNNITLFTKSTGLPDYHNYLDKDSTTNSILGDTARVFNDPKIRKRLHVGNGTYNVLSMKVFKHLEADTVQSVAPWLEVLLDHYRVLIYNGQLDIICAYPMTMNYIYKLRWSGAEEYRAAKRLHWHVQGELAGYAKSGGNLTEVLVRDAGHAAAFDQPVWVLDLIQKFLKSDPIGTQ